MKVAKWGNSLAIRLPAAVVDALGIKEGDDLDVGIGREGVRIDAKMDRDELIKKFARYRGTLPVDFKFDRDEANER